jgi:hypothetical protein
VRISIAIFSYDGGLYFGVTADYDSSSDIDVLTTGVERSMTGLLALLAPPPAKRPRAEREQPRVEGEQSRVEGEQSRVEGEQPRVS